MSALYELQFNVAQLLKESTGATRTHDINAEIKNELDNEIIAVSPLVGQVEFLRAGPNILVTGLLQTTLQKICSRCLTDFTIPASIELEEEFYPAVDIVTGTPLPKSSQVDSAN
jgi:uncharacterized protein